MPTTARFKRRRKTKELPDYAQRMLEARQRAGLTQQEVDKAAGYEISTYAHYEGGSRPGINLATLSRFAKALGVSPSDLLG